MKRRSFTRIAEPKKAGLSDPTPIPGVETGYELLRILRPYPRHCGDSHRPAWKMGDRRLLDYLLVYIADGKGRFGIDGVMYEAEPNDLFWIPPDTVHSMEGFAPSMNCPYVHFDLVYRPDLSHWDFTIPPGMLDLGELKPLMHEPVEHPLLKSLKGRIRSHTNRRVGELIRDVCAEAARAQPYAGLTMSGLLLQVVAEILRGREGLPAGYLAHIPLLERTGDDMIRRCHESLSMEEMARQCELSVSHFRHLFRQHFGMSPRSYVRRARIAKARELMVNTSLTLSEIAVRVGFETVHSLSRAFREMEGIYPSEYRRCAPVKTRVEGRKTPYPR